MTVKGINRGGLQADSVKFQNLARRILGVICEYAPAYVEARGSYGEVRRRARDAGREDDFWDGDAITVLRWLEDLGYIERRPWHRPPMFRTTPKGEFWNENGAAFDNEPEDAA